MRSMIEFVLIDDCLSPAIHELARKYREEFNLPNLKMPFNSNRGFYISFPEKDLQEASMPSVFNQVSLHVPPQPTTRLSKLQRSKLRHQATPDTT